MCLCVARVHISVYRNNIRVCCCCCNYVRLVKSSLLKGASEHSKCYNGGPGNTETVLFASELQPAQFIYLKITHTRGSKKKREPNNSNNKLTSWTSSPEKHAQKYLYSISFLFFNYFSIIFSGEIFFDRNIPTFLKSLLNPEQKKPNEKNIKYKLLEEKKVLKIFNNKKIESKISQFFAVCNCPGNQQQKNHWSDLKSKNAAPNAKSDKKSPTNRLWWMQTNADTDLMGILLFLLLAFYYFAKNLYYSILPTPRNRRKTIAKRKTARKWANTTKKNAFTFADKVRWPRERHSKLPTDSSAYSFFRFVDRLRDK